MKSQLFPHSFSFISNDIYTYILLFSRILYENMCFPPLTWQTYDIDFTAAKFEGGKKIAHARMTVKLNGVAIHQDVEVPKSTTASPKKEGPEPGFVYIQNHGNPVRLRNIWVLPK